MISGTIKTRPMKFCTVIVLFEAYQNTKRHFQNLTYDVTMTQLIKPWENYDLCETRQIIYHWKGNNESFLKMQFLLKLSDWIKSSGYLSKILAYFSRFLPDLSLIILISRDHGCQF